MLEIENWDTGKLQVAMILDELPSRQFMEGAKYIGGHPWRPNSPFLNAFRSPRVRGFSWLLIVYKGDSIHTWGSKRAKAASGGKWYGINRSEASNDAVT